MFSEQDAHALGVEASLDFYPLVTMDLTWKPCTHIEPGKERGTGPMHTFASIGKEGSTCVLHPIRKET